jgi:hypothetical protein
MRRVFWLSVGAALGVAGYRRATALARSLRPQARPESLAGFAADVREGMSLYMERQAGRAPSSTLEAHARRALGAGPGAARSRASRNDEPKDGR